MRRRSLGVTVLVLGLFATALPVFAHHSFAAEFDGSREFVVTGTLTKLEWSNPHIYFYVDVKDADGHVDTYGFQSGPPTMLHRAGIRQSDYKIGETVTITAAPAKDGSKKTGWFKMMKYADGHFFVYRNGAE